jgi:hypothetical protein
LLHNFYTSLGSGGLTGEAGLVRRSRYSLILLYGPPGGGVESTDLSVTLLFIQVVWLAPPRVVSSVLWLSSNLSEISFYFFCSAGLLSILDVSE